jgi:hypothetical protein
MDITITGIFWPLHINKSSLMDLVHTAARKLAQHAISLGFNLTNYMAYFNRYPSIKMDSISIVIFDEYFTSEYAKNNSPRKKRRLKKRQQEIMQYEKRVQEKKEKMITRLVTSAIQMGHTLHTYRGYFYALQRDANVPLDAELFAPLDAELFAPLDAELFTRIFFYESLKKKMREEEMQREKMREKKRQQKKQQKKKQQKKKQQKKRQQKKKQQKNRRQKKMHQ